MATPKAFCGTWCVDNEASDSIEPMLKAMGVGWKIRKIVTMLKVSQRIEVRGDELVVQNISKHGEDSTVHVINAGERVILTNRGDRVIDNCTFDAKQEFPLRIVAILPNGKGSTQDLRKMLPGGDSFLQHLIYKFPGDTGKPDIVMKRIFVRDDPVEAPAKQSSSSSSSLSSVPSPPPPSSSAASPSSPRQPSSSAKSTGAKRDRATVAETKVEDEKFNSEELWAAACFAIMGLTTVFFAAVDDPTALTALDAAPAIIFYVVARVLAQTARGAELVRSPHGRWAGVVAALMACTVVCFRLVANPGVSSVPVQAAGCLASGLALAVARVIAGLSSAETADQGSPIAEALRDLDETKVWMVEVACMAAASVAGFALGPLHPATLAAAFSMALARFATWFRTNVGFERFEPRHASRSKRRRRRSIQDREGRTLKVRVVGHRVVDELYAQYKVQVTHEGLTWFVWRRFSQFDTLRHELRRMFGHGVLPQVPRKTWFASLDEDFLNARVAELDGFVQQLMDESLRRQVFKIAETRKFLGVGQGRGKTPEELAEALAAETPSTKATPEETKELIDVLKGAEALFDKAISVGEGDGWKFMKQYMGVQCYLKVDGDFTYTKGVGTIHTPPLVAAAFMSDLTKRKTYDDLFKKDTLLRELDLAAVADALGGAPVDVCDVKHVEFKSPFPMAITARDTVLLSCRMIYPDGTVKVIMASAPERFQPPTPKYIRAKVFAAGIKVEPDPSNPGACIMTNVQMMDPNGSIPGWVIKAVAPERCAMSAKVDNILSKERSLPDPLPIPHKT